MKSRPLMIWAIAGTVVAGWACGGRVVQGDLGDASSAITDDAAAAETGTAATDDGNGSPGGSTSAELDGSLVFIQAAASCAALADCCAEFTGSQAASCNAIAAASDDAACSSTVTAYQQQGFCQGW
jgi:hypothetical protein